MYLCLKRGVCTGPCSNTAPVQHAAFPKLRLFPLSQHLPSAPTQHPRPRRCTNCAPVSETSYGARSFRCRSKPSSHSTSGPTVPTPHRGMWHINNAANTYQQTPSALKLCDVICHRKQISQDEAAGHPNTESCMLYMYPFS